jgi:hypothetical protein
MLVFQQITTKQLKSFFINIIKYCSIAASNRIGANYTYATPGLKTRISSSLKPMAGTTFYMTNYSGSDLINIDGHGQGHHLEMNDDCIIR